MNIIFDLCAAGLIEGKPLHNVMDNLKPEDHRHVMMRRICLVRGLTYVCILLAVVVLVTHVGVTKVHSAVTDTKAALGVAQADREGRDHADRGHRREHLPALEAAHRDRQRADD